MKTNERITREDRAGFLKEALATDTKWPGRNWRNYQAAIIRQNHYISELEAIAKDAANALNNVPEVGHAYDQQHADTQLAAVVAIHEALGQSPDFTPITK